MNAPAFRDGGGHVLNVKADEQPVIDAEFDLYCVLPANVIHRLDEPLLFCKTWRGVDVDGLFREDLLREAR